MQDPVQSQRWLNIAKDMIKVNTKRRLYQRMDQLEKVVNAVLLSYGTKFTIDHSLKQKILQEILNVIDQYGGTKKLTRNQESSEKSVVFKTRTWWHRVKPAELGAMLFLVICFSALDHFIRLQVTKTSITRLILFIDIFRGFMDETIDFYQTKPKPLIPYQCFLNTGLFKDICSEFVVLFGDERIIWNCHMRTMEVCVVNGRSVHKYIKQKGRAKALYSDYRGCLDKIRTKWSQSGVNIDEFMQKWDTIVHAYCPKTHRALFFHKDTLQTIRCQTYINSNTICTTTATRYVNPNIMRNMMSNTNNRYQQNTEQRMEYYQNSAKTNNNTINTNTYVLQNCIERSSKSLNNNQYRPQQSIFNQNILETHTNMINTQTPQNILETHTNMINIQTPQNAGNMCCDSTKSPMDNQYHPQYQTKTVQQRNVLSNSNNRQMHYIPECARCVECSECVLYRSRTESRSLPESPANYQHRRSFQGMRGFGSISNASTKQTFSYIGRKEMRDKKREEHIEQIQSQLQSNMYSTNVNNNANNNVNYCQPYFEPYFPEFNDTNHIDEWEDFYDDLCISKPSDYL